MLPLEGGERAGDRRAPRRLGRRVGAGRRHAGGGRGRADEAPSGRRPQGGAPTARVVRRIDWREDGSGLLERPPPARRAARRRGLPRARRLTAGRGRHPGPAWSTAAGPYASSPTPDRTPTARRARVHAVPLAGGDVAEVAAELPGPILRFTLEPDGGMVCVGYACERPTTTSPSGCGTSIAGRRPLPHRRRGSLGLHERHRVEPPRLARHVRRRRPRHDAAGGRPRAARARWRRRRRAARRRRPAARGERGGGRRRPRRRGAQPARRAARDLRAGARARSAPPHPPRERLAAAGRPAAGGRAGARRAGPAHPHLRRLPARGRRRAAGHDPRRARRAARRVGPAAAAGGDPAGRARLPRRAAEHPRLVRPGQAWVRALRGDWGGVDAEDCHAVLDALVERGWADPERLGVLGLSYGGFMVNWLVARRTASAAAVSENGVVNQVSAWANSGLRPDVQQDAGLGDPLSPRASSACGGSRRCGTSPRSARRCCCSRARPTCVARRRTPSSCSSRCAGSAARWSTSSTPRRAMSSRAPDGPIGARTGTCASSSGSRATFRPGAGTNLTASTGRPILQVGPG